MSFIKRLTSKRPGSNIDTKNAMNAPSRSMPTRRPQASPATQDAPPAYTPQPDNTNSVVVAQAPAQATAQAPVTLPQVASQPAPPEDSPYSFLTQFDTLFIIDDSGSMAGRSWRETSEALAVITPICTQHDADGIDIYFLNHRNQRSASNLGGYNNVTTTSAVREIFSTVRPRGGTPTGTRLNQILKPYLTELENDLERRSHGREATVKPLNIIVITDGVPSDDVESVIVQAAKKLDQYNAEPWQVGIQFFQVGQEPEAAEELRELDDVLAKQHNIRDMVDTVPWSGEDGAVLSGEGLLKVTMGAVNRRLDRKKT